MKNICGPLMCSYCAHKEAVAGIKGGILLQCGLEATVVYFLVQCYLLHFVDNIDNIYEGGVDEDSNKKSWW